MEKISRRAFVSQILPKKDITKLVSQAANNFCYNLIEANCFDYCLSILPNNISRLVVKGTEEKVDFIYYIPKLKIRPIIIIQIFVESIISLKRLSPFQNIWFYNLTSSTFLLFLILKYILKKKVFVILADYTPNTSSLLSKLIYKQINRSDGLITLSSRIKELSIRNIVNIPGIITTISSVCRVNHKGHRVFLLAAGGAPVERHIIAYKAFGDVSDATLFITGTKSKEEYVKIEQQYQNIRYIGYLSYEEYLSTLNSVDVVLSLRDGSELANVYNFPSKILEAFSFGKAVLSTMCYPELDKFCYVTAELNQEDLAAKIKKYNMMDDDEFYKYADNTDALLDVVSASRWIKELNNVESRCV